MLAGLEGLVNKNLLQPRDGPDGDRRVVQLETVREYGLERLVERGETDAVARRHADYYLAVAEQAEPELLGPEQGSWYERLEADLDNFRAVLGWALAHQQPEVVVQLAAPDGMDGRCTVHARQTAERAGQLDAPSACTPRPSPWHRVEQVTGTWPWPLATLACRCSRPTSPPGPEHPSTRA